MKAHELDPNDPLFMEQLQQYLDANHQRIRPVTSRFRWAMHAIIYVLCLLTFAFPVLLWAAFDHMYKQSVFPDYHDDLWRDRLPSMWPFRLLKRGTDEEAITLCIVSGTWWIAMITVSLRLMGILPCDCDRPKQSHQEPLAISQPKETWDIRLDSDTNAWIASSDTTGEETVLMYMVDGQPVLVNDLPKNAQ